MPRFSSSSQFTPSNWLGLAWVYSALLWLVPVWIGVSAGNLELAGLALVRLLATVAMGIGVCGDERWGWASALALSFAYLLLGSTLGILMVGALSSRPEGALSWQPVIWGLLAEECLRLTVAAFMIAGAAAGAIWLLWRSQSRFDVPGRQVYGTIVRSGLGPALGILMLDAALLLTWR